MKIDAVFEALGPTPRRRFLAYPSEASLTAGEIADRFEMSKPELSKHLKVLENTGLVRGEKKGRFVHYTIADRNVLAILHTFFTTFCPVGIPLKHIESGAIARAMKKD